MKEFRDGKKKPTLGCDIKIIGHSCPPSKREMVIRRDLKKFW